MVVEPLKLLPLLGVTPMPGRAPRVLCDSALAGVGAREGGCFLNGLSGRGSEGRLGLKEGLGGRAPGPTVWANLCGRAGVGGVAFAACPLTVL